MSQSVELIFDFASPNAYLVHKVLPDFQERTGTEVSYTPCLLGGLFKLTNNQPPMMALADIPSKMAYESLETQRFIQRHKLDGFRMNPHFPVNTLQLMRGALGAQEDGYLMEYIDAMTSAMWEQGLKLDDPEVLGKAYADAGFDAPRLAEQMQQPQIKQRLMDNTQSAADRGAFGIPTFFVGDVMYFGKERLGQLEEYLRSGVA